MTKVYTCFARLLFCLIAVCVTNISQSQTTLSTPVPSGIVYVSDTDPGVIVFGVRNNNTSSIIITEIASYVEAGYNGTFTLWYNPTTVTGAPGEISVANGWIQVSPSGNVTGPATGSVVPVVTGISLNIPATTTYRLALQAPIQAPTYGTSGSTGNIVSTGGVDLYMQNNPLSPTYAGVFPGPPTFTPRSFYGSITFSPGDACSTPQGGTATASKSLLCSGSSVMLDLSGNSIGIGQTYQWQTSATSGGTYTNIGTASSSPVLTHTPTTSAWYKAVVTCGTNTAESSPVKVDVVTALSGYYTINPALPAGGNNFQTLTAAVTALGCGISGPVIFDAASGSTFTEQITITEVAGASATNTIRFLGNGSLIQVAPTTSSRAAIRLDGADYVTIDSFNIVTTDATYGWGIHFTNGADYDSVRACTIDISAVTSNTESNSGGIVMSGSNTSVITDGNANYNTIANCVIKGGYRGITITGTTGATNATGNKITGSMIQDFYQNGIELADNDSATVSFNDIHRMNRTGTGTTVVTTFAGVELNGGTKRSVIEGNKIHDTHTAAGTDQGDAAYGVFSTANDAPIGSENKVINNLIYNFNSETGIQYGLYNAGSNGVFYYHNTVSLDNGSSTSGTTKGFYQTTAASNIQLRNNIFYVSRGGTGTKHAVHFNTTTSDILSNNNVFYVTASGSTVGVGSFGTANATTLADWQAANGGIYDQQSVHEDPMFAGGGDYTPQNALINGIGANVGVTSDILGNTRSASPDPGAYEFTVAGLDADIAWVTPVMPVTAGPQTITVKITNTQTIAITGINLSYTDGTTVQTEAFTGLNITSGNSQQLSFTTPYNLTESVTLRAYINLVNGTLDNNQLNDTTARQNLCLPLFGDYTININQPVTSRNFHTLTDAISLLACSGVSDKVRFNVEPGSFFAEQITIPAITGASATNTIRFLGNGAFIQADPNTSDRHLIRLDGADYVTIDSFNIVSTSATYGWGIHFTNGADNDSVRACTIDISTVTSTTQSNSGGIVMSGSPTSVTTDGNANNNTIVNNIIKGGYQGIIITGATGGVDAVGNVIKNNTIQDFYAVGIEITDTDGSLVEGNDIHRMNRSTGGSATTVVTTFAGVELNTGTKNSLIKGNRIHDTHTSAGTDQGDAAYGVFSNGNDAAVGSENRVINNLIYNFNSQTGTQYGLYNSGSNGVFYYHNTIVLDNGGSSSGTTKGFYQTTTATGIDLRNNIFYITRGGTGTKHGVHFNTAGSEITSNKNVFYVSASGSTVGVGSLGTANAATLADWQAVNNGGDTYDQQSIHVDPLFVSPGVDFTPSDPSVNNMGDAVGVTIDITGRMRSLASPDPGAYEFSLLTPGINMVAGALITPAQTDNNCFTATETATLRIRNNSTADIDFAVNPVTVTINITGAGTQTLTEVLNAGVLESDSTMDVVFTTPANMTAAGTYTFNGNVAVTGDVDPSNNAIAPVDRIREALSSGTVTVTPDEYCASSTTQPVLSATGVTGYSGLQWQQSTTSGSGFTDIAGATTMPYTVTTAITQTMYYRLVATCGTATTTSSEDTLQYGDPMITGTTPATRCGVGTADLSATSNVGTIKWYETATGGVAIATGNTFTTPNLTATTTYYAAAAFGGTVASAGLADRISTTGYTQEAGLFFDALSAFTLQGVHVYPTGTGAGTATIALQNTSGTTIASTVVNLTGSATPVKTYVPLDFIVPAGTDYRLVMLTRTGSVSGLIRESGAGWGSYPLTLPGVLSITAGKCCPDASSTSYYYFYDWQVTTACESPRTAVTATVTPGPAFSVSDDTTVCNDGIQLLEVTSNVADFDSYVWTPQTGLYTDAAATVAYTGGSTAQVYAKSAIAGLTTYTVTATNTTTQCGSVDSVKVTVIPVPTIVSSAAGICVSGSTVLSLDPLTGYGTGSFQWQESNDGTTYTDISGATGNTFTTPTITQTTYYRALIKNGAGAVCTQPTITVNVTSPQITGTTPASRCGQGIVNLQATGSTGTTLKWYASATGGTALATGTSFTTPLISSTTDFYVEASVANSGVSSVGPVNPSALGTISATDFPITTYYQEFNVTADVTLLSIDIFPTAAVGTAGSIEIRNSAGTVITNVPYTVAVNDGTTPQTITLNAILTAGTGYRIGQGAPAIDLNRNTSGASYPYTNGPISVTGNNFNTAYWYYIYNWQFTDDCVNPARTAVTATVTPGSSTAAGASGTTECAAETVLGITSINFTDCDPIAVISPSGAAPVSGSVNACVTIDATVQTAPGGEPYVQRHYDITPATNAAIATSTVTLYFLQSEFDAFNTASGGFALLPANSTDATGKANLRITQYNGTGTAPGNYTGSSVQIDPADAEIVWNSTAGRWEITFSATGSGGFYVHTGNFVLPVTQLNFSGELAGEANRLVWSTATETNNKGFELERSADGRNFSSLTFVATKAANGNSTSVLNYSYVDAKPFAGNNYYRLKQVDRDGKYSYSNIVMLGRKVKDITLSSVYPNPTTRDINLVITSPRAEKVTIVVTDLSGKTVMQSATQLMIGENQQTLNVQQLAAGTYIIKAVCANGCETAVHRFVKR